MILRLTLFVLVVIEGSVPYRILGVLPFKGTSHNLVMLPLFDELAKLGHDVSVMSYFPKEELVANYTSLSFKLDSNVKLRGFTRIDEIGERYPLMESIELIRLIDDEMENAMKSTHIQKVIKEKWDAVIVEYFNTNMFASIAYKTGAPLILFQTSDLLPFHRISLAEPLSPSYIPHPYSAHCPPMSFFDRLVNTLEVYYHATEYHFNMRKRGQQLAEKYLGPLPDMTEVIKNASLFLVNTHPSFHGATPASPFVVQVGGIHLRAKKPLPQDLIKILDKTKGVIYFSLGSVLKGDSLKEHQLELFVRAFALLPVDVLWKYEGTIVNKPSNIHLISWLPQRDMLGHHKLHVFISHCGLLSVEEALTEGVPIICIPMFGDQHFNARRVEALGIGLTVDFWSLSVPSLEKTVRRVLSDSRYKENALKVKETFNDRPASPLETAVYWVEYVARHKGAPHLKSAARYLRWYELRNLDVWGIFLGGLIIVLYVILFILRLALEYLCRIKTKGTTKKPIEKASIEEISAPRNRCSTDS